MHEGRSSTPGDESELQSFQEAQETRREALREHGYTFFLKIQPKSIRQLMDEYPDYFGYVGPSKDMREFIPGENEVAVNSDSLFLPDSFRVFVPGKQIRMIEDHGSKLRQQSPQLGGVKFKMAHASVYMQLDYAYQQIHGGQKLFTSYSARTADKMLGFRAINIGRRDSRDGRLIVSDWFVEIPEWTAPFLHGSPKCGALPVAVLPTFTP